MQPFILFVDTETSDMPIHWDAPVSDLQYWPFIIQLSWVIFNNEGQFIKEEDHYIYSSDIQIKQSAFEVHGISLEFLKVNGESREEVILQFYQDLKKYKPLIVAHFAKLDINMLGVGFERIGFENIIDDYPVYCTMLGTSKYNDYPNKYYPALDELYFSLFKKRLENYHNAIVDARATAACFFELLKKGEITDEHILAQQLEYKSAKEKKWTCLPIFVFIPFMIVVYYLIFFSI